MKKNMLATMNRLEIDEKIRNLMRQLWKHNYKTTASCKGHFPSRPYILFKEGDGWFEKHAPNYGWEKFEKDSCCKDYEKNFPNENCCGQCGAGINGNTIYRRNYSFKI